MDHDQHTTETPASNPPSDQNSDQNSDPNSFPLDKPIVRGDQTITRVKLRKPNAEALRGTQLAPLSQMDVDQLCKLLPRISTPSLTEAEVAHMEAPDIMKAGVIVLGFLFPTQAKELQSLNV